MLPLKVRNVGFINKLFGDQDQNIKDEPNKK